MTPPAPQSPQRTRRLQITMVAAVALPVLLVMCSRESQRIAAEDRAPAPSSSTADSNRQWADRVLADCARQHRLDTPGRRLDQADVALLTACVEGAKAGKAAAQR